MANIAGTDRTQAVLLPEILDDYVGADNPVRFVEAFVAQLDLAELGFQRAVPAETGRPGYDPGDLLRLYLFRTTTLELGRTIKSYRTSACGRCALRPRCTRNRDGRKITRWVDEHLLEEMAVHLRRAPDLFARRKELFEHPYGTMKRAMDQGYFLLKGLRKVRGESGRRRSSRRVPRGPRYAL
jgi:macrodomain Ter protein organizer (MatP/YcbG family)